MSDSSRARARHPEHRRVEPSHSSPVALHERIPWIPLLATLAVLVSAAFAVSPIRDAATLAAIPEARLQLSSGYVALAPLSSILDTLTLLGVRQHLALLVSLIALYVASRAWRRRAAAETRNIAQPAAGTRVRPVAREIGYAFIFFVAILGTYAVGALVPRPMAALTLSPPDLYLSADFHAHTRYSHDGRSGWEPEDVRAWQRSAGVDVAYIADHRTVQGAELGIANNPAQAGQGTMILQALELGWRGEHVNVLGAERVFKGLTTPGLRDVDEQALALASILAGREPIVIGTIPGHPERMIAASGPGTPGIRAIELVDGAPRGLDQSRLQRARILKLADSLGLALVSGSDNHGWGRAMPAWTLLRLPGWRGMTTDSLAFVIERTLRLGTEATRIAERRVAGELNGANALELTFTLPLVAWRMLTTLSTDERVMWIVWAWALFLLARVTRRWRLRRARVV